MAIVAAILLFAFATPLLAVDPIPAMLNGHYIYVPSDDPNPAHKWDLVCACVGDPPYECICMELIPPDQLCYKDWLRGLDTYYGEDDDYLYFNVDYNETTDTYYYLQTIGTGYMALPIEWVEYFDDYCD